MITLEQLRRTKKPGARYATTRYYDAQGRKHLYTARLPSVYGYSVLPLVERIKAGLVVEIRFTKLRPMGEHTEWLRIVVR